MDRVTNELPSAQALLMTGSEPHFMQAQLHLKEAHWSCQWKNWEWRWVTAHGPLGSENLPGFWSTIKSDHIIRSNFRFQNDDDNDNSCDNGADVLNFGCKLWDIFWIDCSSHGVTLSLPSPQGGATGSCVSSSANYTVRGPDADHDWHTYPIRSIRWIRSTKILIHIDTRIAKYLILQSWRLIQVTKKDGNETCPIHNCIHRIPCLHPSMMICRWWQPGESNCWWLWKLSKILLFSY